jgi:hypothetical protein
MSDFGEEYNVPLLCDRTSSISIAKNPVLHSKTKHIDVSYHFLRDNVEKGKITLILVPHMTSELISSPSPYIKQLSLVCGGNLVCVCFLELGVGAPFVAYV